MDQIESVLEKIQETVDNALDELMEVKIIRENDPTDYSFAQKQLEDMKDEIGLLMNEVNPNDQKRLLDALETLRDVQKTMVRGI